jgi:hypothetical protein
MPLDSTNWAEVDVDGASALIRAATLDATPREVREACARLRSAIGLVDIAAFNDRQKTVEPILAAFDRAIATAAPSGGS